MSAMKFCWNARRQNSPPASVPFCSASLWQMCAHSQFLWVSNGEINIRVCKCSTEGMMRRRISHLYGKGACPDKISSFFWGLEEHYADNARSWTEIQAENVEKNEWISREYMNESNTLQENIGFLNMENQKNIQGLCKCWTTRSIKNTAEILKDGC